jgi:hypothetical protein
MQQQRLDSNKPQPANSIDWVIVLIWGLLAIASGISWWAAWLLFNLAF